MFQVLLTDHARGQLEELRGDPGRRKRHRAVIKAIRLLAANPRHPGLRTHQYSSLTGPSGAKVYEAYAEQGTPAAYRVFWCYGPARDQITILAITPHP